MSPPRRRPWRGVAVAGAMAGCFALAAAFAAAPAARAQGRPRGAAHAAPAHAPMPRPSARAHAPFDPSGYWVSVITEGWRFRMVLPGRGQYQGIPLNVAAKRFADAWSPIPDERDGQQCKAYGAPALMWMPERLHISWQNANTLKVQTDAGMQTRLLYFKPTAAEAAAPPSRQGFSVATWVHPGGGSFAAPPKNAAHFGYIKVVTDHLLPGYLRKNGLPYSAQARLTEYWALHTGPAGAKWLTITSDLKDPRYLQDPYLFTPIFRREPDGSQWAPTRCSLRW